MSRHTLVVALVAVLAVVGVGCKQPSNTPSAYDSTTQANFIHGCTGNGSGTSLASQDACQCAYNWLVENVPYNSTNASTPTTVTATRVGTTNTDDTVEISQSFIDTGGATFSSINSDIAKNPDSVPQSVQDGMAKACASKGWKVQPTGGPTTSTTG